MKCELHIDKNTDEKVLIYAHEQNKAVDEIKSFVENQDIELVGYKDGEIEKLNPNKVNCFIIENSKIYAITDDDKYHVKLRLYNLEEMLGESFIKINQSCIANIRKIKKFDSSISGTLSVVFKNGYIDYVSRRNIKSIKERLGL